jgi:antitoxin component YwqK of YwqJK toxin-antitoxin module
MKRWKVFKQVGLGIVLCMLLIAFTGAKRSQNRKPRLLPLSSVHIIDRNGFSETISNKERLNQFQNVNFLSSQPYQKVLRIYARDSKGNIRSVVNTYHENGNPKQFLEILNARANGNYCEWHENGNMSIIAKVIGGAADVTSIAEKTWLFDGPSYAWDEEEHQIAEINYSQGSLEGISTYFHPNGQIWKQIPYTKNQLEGTAEIFRSNGELLQQITYSQGQRHGPSVRYWEGLRLASHEDYCRGKLENGQYFDKQGNLIAEVKHGTGYRAIFSKENIQELQEFIDGSLEGEVKVFNQEGRLKRIYHVKNGIKHGEEVEYYLPLRLPCSPSLLFIGMKEKSKEW